MIALYEAICQACDGIGPVDDMLLCKSCAGKLERDMLRIRAWDYSALAFGCPIERREELRAQVMAEHGEELELITDEAPNGSKPVVKGGKRNLPGSRGGRKRR